MKKEPWARLGVNIEKNFEPLYVISPEKTQQVKKLRDLLKDAEHVAIRQREAAELLRRAHAKQALAASAAGKMSLEDLFSKVQAGGVKELPIVLKADVPESMADLPRVGVAFALPARFSQMRWYGRGPHENYPDRNRGAVVGTWQQELDRPPYLVPQEFGLRTDCRWFELVDPKRGQAVRVDVLQADLGSIQAEIKRLQESDK